MPSVSAPAITWRLKALADAPVRCGDHVLTLRRLPDHEGSWFEVAATLRGLTSETPETSETFWPLVGRETAYFPPLENAFSRA